jgi:hypothetical protein
VATSAVMSRFEIEVSAAEQLDIVHARIGRLVFQPFLFPPESFPAALLRELRYARTLLCCDSRWERKGAGLEAKASYPLPAITIITTASTGISLTQFDYCESESRAVITLRNPRGVIKILFPRHVSCSIIFLPNRAGASRSGQFRKAERRTALISRSRFTFQLFFAHRRRP